MDFYKYHFHFSAFVSDSKLVFYSPDTLKGKITDKQKPCEGYWLHSGGMHYSFSSLYIISIYVLSRFNEKLKGTT